MATPQVDPSTATASYNSLVRQIADRDPAALAHLHRLLVRRIFVHVRAGLGDTAAAVSIVRAVFVEVWRLAPASRMWHDDAHAWLLTIADRRVAEHLRARGRPFSLAMGYDEHISLELNALLRYGRPARRDRHRRSGS
ncbi:hypothetical protein GCM10010399_24720 [Dactylosporangium fulvum]|uniref:RNA polymerase sigma-70 region 2 domain-containing protein n=1 Tax=Dactylosporangium fulvum TaxID=53359 RepID=A0ABY5W8T8_9ACTN|nr:sigma factor [Dactylosporangium fulvum]UWP85486.1 hypothetical protein Dfulv_15095 [Dactylosporangium fulvum]